MEKTLSVLTKMSYKEYQLQ